MLSDVRAIGPSIGVSLPIGKPSDAIVPPTGTLTVDATDFTVTVTPKDMRNFRAAKFDVKALAGKRVRVRGWIESYNGPEMEIATPAAIEVLDLKIRNVRKDLDAARGEFQVSFADAIAPAVEGYHSELTELRYSCAT